MPSQPDPNSPFLSSQLQADFGLRTPGTPTLAGKPTVQPGDVTFPAPPGVAEGLAGRPPTPPVPAPTITPPTGTAATPPVGAPAAGAGAAPAVPAPLVVPVPSAGGDPRLALSPEGDARYRDAVVRGRSSLGPVPAVFRNPNLPQMPFEVGVSNYNPWTGQFVKG